ncbi:choice-of-anchor I family protein [Psychromonas sp. SR45-3]|uniref:choice-of-anchor I family protein n=1 Tax=Psychromonas sp. SR45-3 TaxID=2760930 RepID=UPI0015FB43C4|nr:choice-of-anchor I family protein [Psychromonas sp. SR45-3]MBB1272490.1 choice-of-anchor I family protein [Psychromonas sp. SR45-3]
MKLNLLTSIILSSTLIGCANTPSQLTNNQHSIKLQEAGRYQSNIFDQSAAEIVTFDKLTQQTFVVNAQSGQIDVIDSHNIDAPTLVKHLDIKADIKQHFNAQAGAANSVDVYNGLLAVAIEAKTKTDAGWVAFYNTQDLSFISAHYVGALPDMLSFTPNGKQLVVAIEAEPSEGNYAIDPEGEIAIIDIKWENQTLSSKLTRLTFTDFNQGAARHHELPPNLLLNGYQASIAQDIEPEYIAINQDSSKAYVALQENNAIAIVDLATKSIQRIMPLGFKDHLAAGNEIDGNDKDKKALLNKEALLGMYQPDTIATVKLNNIDYLITANEGDDRSDWISDLSQAECEAGHFYYHLKDKNCSDDIKLKDAFSAKVYQPQLTAATLDLSNFKKGGSQQSTVKHIKFSHSLTAQHGDLDGDGKIDRLLTFGGRSFSIWDIDNSKMIFDSGSDFERITAQKYGNNFNQTHNKLKAENRSAKKGPEPEALTTGTINGKTYAFIGLERMGGIMVYDISQPKQARFVQYLNNRDMTVNPKDNKQKNAQGVTTYQVDAGDLGPEGFKFVSAEDSPSGTPILIVGNEVSGSTRFYRVMTNQ